MNTSNQKNSGTTGAKADKKSETKENAAKSNSKSTADIKKTADKNTKK